MKFFGLLLVVKATLWMPLKLSRLFQPQRLVNKLLPLTSGLLSTKRVSFFTGGQWSSNVLHLPPDGHTYKENRHISHGLKSLLMTYAGSEFVVFSQKKLRVMHSSYLYWNTLLHAFISRKFSVVGYIWVDFTWIKLLLNSTPWTRFSF